eukprot:SAG11_NODE_1955_length_4005_cov_2.390937_1_plen_74_part_10
MLRQDARSHARARGWCHKAGGSGADPSVRPQRLRHDYAVTIRSLGEADRLGLPLPPIDRWRGGVSPRGAPPTPP